MDNNVYQQLYSLFLFILTGFVIGILFDLFRILRKSFKTPDIITYLQDILFWILTGFTVLFAIFTFQNGELRAYLFIGIGIGIIFYMLTISKYIIKCSVSIINIIIYPFKILIKSLSKFIIKPISAIFFKIQKNIEKFCKISFKKIKISKKR